MVAIKKNYRLCNPTFPLILCKRNFHNTVFHHILLYIQSSLSELIVGQLVDTDTSCFDDDRSQ
ncbi:hypothetical protein CPB83DRAFT_861818 [Crepidotus variabilis]|uniref:Uncharacterized protein n=1 Tax=Crepidotus variabilis TaxID=179855 RepID=A0A9P6JKA4_9AGAR|nr:hypothetical protein CPB83DRAFT_861818 [Crepidotus variabilis]